ncbi:uncharacterized protein LOC122385156 [Amphibalanus amphitrite]|uniref:uncharacterized protein LOC122385156 n=1 Tax=Amphibalanus amphitrite TaxID=1232801 RepID=UPI001C8FF815|nr:uncharacterized protein LOC122385156 [Amphibalanus amphitrite]
MTQLKSKEPPPTWKEREINGNCEFGVKSYLHQFYDGPESVDFDLYEYEEDQCDQSSWPGPAEGGRRRRRACCRPAGCVRPLLILSLLLLASAGSFLLLLVLLPPPLALLTAASDVTAAELAALTAACMGATGTLVSVCLMLQVKSNALAAREGGGEQRSLYRSQAAPPSPTEATVPATAQLISIQPDAPPRYDVTRVQSDVTATGEH